MKFLLSATMTVFLTVSSMAQADNSSVAVDSLGLPSSALLLTDTESDNTRGTYWDLYKKAQVAYKEERCWKASNKKSDLCLKLADVRTFNKEKWQEYKELDESAQTNGEIEFLRSYSY